MLTPGADPVRKVSIIPRGAALGVTLSAPDDDQVSYTREDLLGKIKVALGGRVAEETVFGTITTGAESDIDQVTAVARQMVGRWGMSDAIGFVRVLPADGRGPFPGSSGETSEATQQVLDEEVRQLIDAAHIEVTTLLAEHRDRLETLTRALLKDETLDEVDAYAAAQMPPRNPDAPVLDPPLAEPPAPTRIEA
jgi:cell division protease FtsH